MTQKNSWVINSDASQVTACKKWRGSMTWFLVITAIVANVGVLFLLNSVYNEHGFGGKFYTLVAIFGIGAIFLNYLAAFFLFNSTELVLDRDRLKIESSPIPSFDKVEIESKNIDQVFVTQIDGQKIGSYNNYYELKAKLKDGETKTLLSYTYQLNEDKALDLEQKMESLLGISDEYVRGEYIEPIPPDFVKIQQKPKRVSMEDSYIYNSNIEDWVFIKQHHQILHITQFDWSNGDSDKAYQTINEDEKEQLFYLDRNKGLLNIYSENSISLSEVIHLNIKPDAPTASFSYENQTFSLDQIYEGNSFYDGQKGATETKQMVYLSEYKNQMVRIVFNGNAPFYYLGSKMEAKDFEELDADFEQLDLDAPVKQKSLDLLDRDLV